MDRRTFLKLAGAGTIASAGAVVGASWWYRHSHTILPLHSQAVAFRSPGVQELVPADTSAGSLVAGTRVWANTPDAEALVAAERSWLGASAPWVRHSPWSELAHTALQDLYSLQVAGLSADGSHPVTTTVAAWSPKWRYVWPRDTAFVAAALAAAGKLEEAVEHVSFFAGRIRPDRWLEARYEYHTPYIPAAGAHAGQAIALGVPDDRPAQLDGAGWLLWSAGQIAAHPGGLQALVPLAPFLAELVEAILYTTKEELLPVSPDYWEMKEQVPVLGVAAPLLAGLQAVQVLGSNWRESEPVGTDKAGAEKAAAGLIDARLTEAADSRAQALEGEIRRRYGSKGYPRQLGGRKRDTAVAFLLPPFAHVADPELMSWARRARREMHRPAGGVAPGVQWTKDGISWTPETAIFGLIAAYDGQDEWAHEELAWLARHRTALGALPEKVLFNHSPAAPAPLAWTSAVVLLTLARLASGEATR